MAKAKAPKETTELIAPHEAGSADLALVMEGEAKKRELITRYIAHHMKEGTDYGTISFGSKASKPTLFKPGSEKFLSLFRLSARFEKDADTWDMAGSEKGVFAYKCTLVATNGTIVGEGRGVSKLTEKTGWTINTAVKIAEKRAQVDAVLRTGALSDFFTQDLEDMVGYDNSPVADNAPVLVVTAPEELSEAEQKQEIMRQLKKRGAPIGSAQEIETYLSETFPEEEPALTPNNYQLIIKLLRQ